LRLPRDLSGHDLISLLKPYGYRVTRQVGSHVRLESTLRGEAHHITIPAHHSLRLGTLNAILSDAAQYLKIDRSDLLRQLFGK
jgi:predicted RNA binding protein YcfA (HicA-like mRNA interferase family)